MTQAKVEAAMAAAREFLEFAQQCLDYAGRVGRTELSPEDSKAMKREAIDLARALAEMRERS